MIFKTIKKLFCKTGSVIFSTVIGVSVVAGFFTLIGSVLYGLGRLFCFLVPVHTSGMSVSSYIALGIFVGLVLAFAGWILRGAYKLGEEFRG